MKITDTKQDKTSFSCKVTVPAKDLEKIVDDRLAELGKTVEIDGFRKGKAPVSILRTKYEQNVMGEALEKSAQESITKVVDENKLRPADQPQISIESFEKGSDLVFTISMSLLPEIKLMDMSKIKVEKTEVTIDEKEVDEAVQNMAKNLSSTAPISKPRKSKSGDTLVFDFSGSVDGEKFEGGTAENYKLELGSGQFIPGFEDQLIGLNAGDEKDVVVTFPADYGAENLAGKEAVFACKVHAIEEPAKTEINDQMAMNFGFESLENLRDNVKRQMLGDYENILFSRVKRQVLDALADGHKFDLPESLSKGEFDQIWQQFTQAKEQGKIPDDEANKDEDELKTEYQEIADRRVALGLILAEIGNQNDIVLTDEEITNAAMQEASRYPGQEQQVLEYFQNNQDAMASLRGPLYENKVVEFVLDKAQVKTNEITTDQLVKMMEKEEQEEQSAKPKKSAKKAKAKSAEKSADKDDKKAPAKKATKKKSSAKKSKAKKS